MPYEEHLLTNGFDNNGHALSFISAKMPHFILKDNEIVLDKMSLDEIDIDNMIEALLEMKRTYRQLGSVDVIYGKGEKIGE